MTRSADTYADAISKRLTKRAIGKIAEKVSGELSSGFAEKVLETISAAAYVRTFDDRVALRSRRHCGGTISATVLPVFVPRVFMHYVLILI